MAVSDSPIFALTLCPKRFHGPKQFVKSCKRETRRATTAIALLVAASIDVMNSVAWPALADAAVFPVYPSLPPDCSPVSALVIPARRADADVKSVRTTSPSVCSPTARAGTQLSTEIRGPS